MVQILDNALRIECKLDVLNEICYIMEHDQGNSIASNLNAISGRLLFNDCLMNESLFECNDE